MESEFKKRVKDKRETIEKMRLRAREHALTDALVICERCNLDIALVKTLDFVTNELHQTRCPFGKLSRVELVDAQSSQYADDKDFVDLYLDEYDNLRN